MFCRRFVHVEGLGDEFRSFPKASARTWDRFTPSCVFNVSALADLATSACGHVNPHQSESSDTARPILNAREVCAMFYYGFVWKKGVAAHACHTHCRLSGPCTPGRDIFLKCPPAHLSPHFPPNSSPGTKKRRRRRRRRRRRVRVTPECVPASQPALLLHPH